MCVPWRLTYVRSKAIGLFQGHVLKKGSQNNESLVDHLKDKMVAEAIRNQVEKVTGLKRS